MIANHKRYRAFGRDAESERYGPSAWTVILIRRCLCRFTLDGELNDIFAIGQTMAAHDPCAKLPLFKRLHHMQPGVGHYGVFSGRRWENQVVPMMRNLILANA